MPLRVIAKDSGPRLRVVGLPPGLPKIEFMGVPLYTARTPSPVSITSLDATIVWSGVNVFDKALYKNAAIIRYNSASGGTYSFDCADLVIDYDRYADVYLRITSKGSPYTVYAFSLAYCNDPRQVSVSIVYRIDDGTPRNCYVFEDGDEVYYYVLDNVQSVWVVDLGSIGYRLGNSVSMAYVNQAGTEQATATLEGYTSTTAYDKSGQTMAYDATKVYTVTERGSLGVWQPNDDMFSLVQNVNNNNLEIRNNMTDARTLAAVKYIIEDNPTAEIWYSQAGGSLENTLEIAAYGRCPMLAADGSVANYNTLYFGSKDIVAWHDGNSWHSNTKSSRFDMQSVNGAYMRNLTSVACRCSAVLTVVIGSNHQGLTGFVSVPGRDYTNSSASWMTLRTGDGQAIPYDATKNYVILGTYLKDGTSVTGVLDGGITKNGAIQLQVRQKANTTLCYVKYTTKDLVKMYLTYTYFPLRDLASTSYYTPVDADGKTMPYDTSKKYTIIRGHDTSRDVMVEANNRIGIINHDGEIWAERTLAMSGTNCFDPNSSSYYIDYLLVLVEDL